jgi:two-component system, chemotaxis family, protein-glutamate methylesterase/glutaminase
MPARDIIVIGASAGGVEVLRRLVGGLPAGLPAALFVVCHVPPGRHSILPEILSRAGPLLATHARDGEPIYPGQIYVAPPDHHLLLDEGQMRLSHGPRENRHRPAVDPLFRSAARAYGARVIGVVLSGALDDGAAGLLAIRSAGGVGVVQDPEDAAVASMPRSAWQLAGADHIVAAAELPVLLSELVNQNKVVESDVAMADPSVDMSRVIDGDLAAQRRNERDGQLSTFTCPECGGALWQFDAGTLTRFSCHVGHIYGAEMLLAEQADNLEAALWTAVRIFKEKTILGRQLAANARGQGQAEVSARFEEDAQRTEEYGQLIQQYLLRGAPTSALAGAGGGGIR